MTDADALYLQLKPAIEAVATPLFDFSELCLKKRGNFLPHGAVLTTAGEVRLIGASPHTKSDYTNSTEVLPILHADLRSQVAEGNVQAVGVAENVTITRSGQKSTRAIKVLFEHERGLTVALYLPFNKKLFRDLTFGTILSVPAKPEVSPWKQPGPHGC